VHSLTLRREKLCEHCLAKLNRGTEGLQMRIGVGMTVVVAIGLIWSIAVMSQWVPLTSAEMKSAALIQPYEAGRP
jgi:hypothetical protein